MSRIHRPVVIAMAVVAVAVGTPIAWYLGSPVFLRSELYEPPVSAVEPTSPGPVPATATIDAPSAVPASRLARPPATVPVTTPPPRDRRVADRTGRFTGTDDFHFGRGTATLREVEPGRWVVRLEDFSVRNGPDLYVVLSPSRSGYTGDSIEIGRLKATDGSFNMPVPAGADVSRVKSVLIWCKQFSHLFAVAPLAG